MTILVIRITPGHTYTLKFSILPNNTSRNQSEARQQKRDRPTVHLPWAGVRLHRRRRPPDGARASPRPPAAKEEGNGKRGQIRQTHKP
jgi:hypothetical protein